MEKHRRDKLGMLGQPRAAVRPPRRPATPPALAFPHLVKSSRQYTSPGPAPGSGALVRAFAQGGSF